MAFIRITYFPPCLQASLSLQSGGGHTTAAGTLPFPPPVLAEGLRFMRACLSHSAEVTEEQKLTNRTLGPITTYLAQLSGSAEGEGELNPVARPV